MLSNKISVIIPVVRPESAVKCIESIKKHLPGAEIITRVDHDRIGCPKMVNQLNREATREWIMFLGDDTELTEDFEQALEPAINKIGWGVIGLNTEPMNCKAHWMAHRNMLNILPDGVFFPEDYQHCYCDDELYDVANENGRWAFAEGALVKHHHPINHGKMDEFYTDAYTNDRLDHDRRTYHQRKRKRLNKIAIGFPLVNDTVPVPFFTSFACMQKPVEYTLLFPEVSHGPWTGSIADARNSLVAQALQDGASYLMMADTDQVYPQDALTKLLSHKVDICGVKVHSRWFPYAPVFYRGSVGKYQFIPNEEMYSGKLVEIDATGTGCLLINMEIFDRLEPPWFKFDMNKGNPVGEDIYFCHKAREAGIKIYVDTSIEVGHLATMEINETLHKLCQKMAKTED